MAELLVSEPLETANDDNPETGVIIYPTIITTIAELLVSEPYHDTTDSDSSSDSASLPDSSSDSSSGDDGRWKPGRFLQTPFLPGGQFPIHDPCRN